MSQPISLLQIVEEVKRVLEYPGLTQEQRTAELRHLQTTRGLSEEQLIEAIQIIMRGMEERHQRKMYDMIRNSLRRLQ